MKTQLNRLILCMVAGLFGGVTAEAQLKIQ